MALAQSYMDAIRRFPSLTPQEEQELAVKIQAGDDDACQHLVNCNLRLAVFLANKYTWLGTPVEDLVSEASISLMKAAKTFLPDAGAKFSTWAAQRIKWDLVKYADTLIYIPSNVRSGLNSDKVKDKYKDAARNAKYIVSMDAELSEDGNTFADILPDENAAMPFAEILDSGNTVKIMAAMSRLTPKEREVLELNFGIGTERQTGGQIAARFGVSRQRIYQIKEKALEKLRRRLAGNKPVIVTTPCSAPVRPVTQRFIQPPPTRFFDRLPIVRHHRFASPRLPKLGSVFYVGKIARIGFAA